MAEHYEYEFTMTVRLRANGLDVAHRIEREIREKTAAHPAVDSATTGLTLRYVGDAFKKRG